jgi:hypothetical protein
METVVGIQWRNIASEAFLLKSLCDVFRIRLEAATTLRQPDNAETTQTTVGMTRKRGAATSRWAFPSVEKDNDPPTKRRQAEAVSPGRLPRASLWNVAPASMMKQKRPLEKRPL